MKYFMLVVLFVMAGCGSTVQKSSVGYNEQTEIHLIAQELIGLNVSLGDAYSKVIEPSDLEKYQLNIFGTKRSERGEMELIILKAEKGQNRLTITEGNVVVYDKVLYLNQGQKREVEIQ